LVVEVVFVVSFEVVVIELIIFGFGVGLVVMAVFLKKGRELGGLSFIRPVITAIKTITTTKPRTKEMTLLALSIIPVLYHYKIIIANIIDFS
jgi:hypothetical protein